jgi:hypothetical protein
MVVGGGLNADRLDRGVLEVEGAINPLRCAERIEDARGGPSRLVWGCGLAVETDMSKAYGEIIRAIRDVRRG